jgi:ATP-binding cassette, subfamily B, bacterial PglK
VSELRKVYGLLSPRERLQAYGMFAVILAVSLLQVAGIASIAPFLALVADPTAVDRNRYLSWAYHALNFESTTRFLVFVGLGVFVVFTISSLFSMFTTWAMVRFAWGRNYSLSVRLLSHYLNMPYAFFLSRNTSSLGKNVLAEVGEVVSGVILRGLQALARLVSAVAIVALLVVVDPVLAFITTAVLGGVYLFVYLIVRQKLARIGERRFQANTAKYKAIGEGLAGIKEIRILGREPVFLGRYSKAAKEYVRARIATEFISKVPHHLVEILAFGGLLLIVLYLLVFRGDLKQVMPIIGLYAFASYRLLPALGEVFGGITAIRSRLAPLDHLYEELRQQAMAVSVNRDEITAIPLRDTLGLHQITFRYGEGQEPILKEFSVTVRANTSVAFVGATGSGKTTTVDIILGLLQPESGQLMVDGVVLTEDRLPSWQKSLGYVPQHIFLSDDTIAHNIAFGVPDGRVDQRAVERAARIANLHDFIVNELASGYDTVVGERGVRLSGGQRQRVGIARAVYHDPDVLVFDEATSALDNVTEESVLQAVETIARTKTVIMIAHRLSTVRKCDEIFVLDRGRIVAQGSYDQLMETSPQFQAIVRGVATLGKTVDAQIVA